MDRQICSDVLLNHWLEVAVFAGLVNRWKDKWMDASVLWQRWEECDIGPLECWQSKSPPYSPVCMLLWARPLLSRRTGRCASVSQVIITTAGAFVSTNAPTFLPTATLEQGELRWAWLIIWLAFRVSVKVKVVKL